MYSSEDSGLLSSTMATDNKYDRQLRLWGSHGQRALAEAKVCLLNAGPTGSESLKNLILPGCGYVTIVDSCAVEAADLANNFFVSPETIGRPRAEVVMELLTEMNPDVQESECVNKSPDDVIKNDPGFFSSFGLILATQLCESSMRALGAICAEKNIPLICATSFGFIGHVRVFVPEHCIVEAKPEPTPLEDLRVANPWPGLVDLAQSVQLETLDEHIHSHVPYVIVLLQLAQIWKNAHGGALATTTGEKEEFKRMIKEASLDYQRRVYSNKLTELQKAPSYAINTAAGKTPDDCMEEAGYDRPAWGAEENFQEAYDLAYTAHVARDIPWEVEELFNDPKASATTVSSSPYWIVVRAMKEFVANEGNGWLPLSGSVPDMTASNEMYIALQKVYNEKAKDDYNAVLSRVYELLKTTGIDPRMVNPLPYADSIEGMVKLFCKNGAFMQVLRHRTIEDELTMVKDEDGELPTCSNIQMDLMMKGMDESYQVDQCCGLWYIMLRAAWRFYENNDRYPGTGERCSTQSLSEDAAAVFREAQSLCQELGFEECPVKADHATEITRYGASELHNIASFVGGVVSQEAVKVLTRQYVPVNNTYIFNGITGDGISFVL